MDWGEFFGRRLAVALTRAKRLIIPISKIRAATGFFQNIDRPWWWELVRNADGVASVRLEDDGLACEPQVVGGSVKSVIFGFQNHREEHAVPFRVFAFLTEDRDVRHAGPPF
jgi:hypothetical protein